jgi:type I restriction enzyme R subunit
MARNEAETRAELINPALATVGWGANESRIRHEYPITKGRIQLGGKRGKQQIADYILEYKGRKLAVIEAKKESLSYTEGVGQAKAYATKLQIRFTYATNGLKIYQIDMQTGHEAEISAYPTPDELWSMTVFEVNELQESFNEVAYEDKGGQFQPRFYQELAVNAVLDAIAHNQNRILLTMATGTGKTGVAFQIAWKLFHSRWNIAGDEKRRPRILFLADRNILANQAYLAFGAFSDDARVRIKPSEIKKKGHVPKNGNVFFTIFQTFMSGEDGTPNFGEYPPDFFDFIIIDECHRGGANDESSWREIMNYFSPAVQLGLTATPKRNTNVDTYEYFGEPVYTYSLKDGINDGFLTPFRVKRITSDIDEYTHTPDDQVLEGEVEAGKVYTEGQINNEIYIPERELLRVKEFMSRINQYEKTLVFCANQWHAGVIRDVINQVKDSKNPDYCVRVTANDGEIGEEWLRKFQDNDKSVPTILTTSHKLSTGVDALNVRNIVLLRPIKSMIEFKQIVGRGTRLFEGKDYFTIYDFVKAYEHFSDPEWDGDPEEPELPPEDPKPPKPPVDTEPEDPDGGDEKPRKDKAVIKLRDGKLRAVSASLKSSTMFIGPTGTPISAEEFIGMLYDTLALPEYFADEDQLRELWSDPVSRRVLLNRLAEAGFAEQDLEVIMKLIEAENSDLYDVLEFVAYAKVPISRVERVLASRPEMQAALSSNQRDFIDFVLDRYMSTGVEELDADKLPDLIKLKYNALQDGLEALGGAEEARAAFVGFQKYLYLAG